MVISIGSVKTALSVVCCKKLEEVGSPAVVRRPHNSLGKCETC